MHSVYWGQKSWFWHLPSVPCVHSCRHLHVPTVHTVVTHWPVAVSLGLLQEGLVLQPFHGMSFDAFSPRSPVLLHWKMNSTSGKPLTCCCAYTCTAWPMLWPFHLGSSPHLPHSILCVYWALKCYITRWSGNNDERNAAHLPRARQLHAVLSFTPLEDWDL